MSTKLWKFINTIDKSEIVIDNEAAAQALIQALKAPIWNLFYEESRPLTQKNPAPPSLQYEERRKNPRHAVTFRVVIVSGGKSFRTFSDNISIGGTLLKHKAPKHLTGKVCKIFIGSEDLRENIEFSCRILGSDENPRNIQFINCDNISIKRLEKWITKAMQSRKSLPLNKQTAASTLLIAKKTAA